MALEARPQCEPEEMQPWKGRQLDGGVLLSPGINANLTE